MTFTGPVPFTGPVELTLGPSSPTIGSPLDEQCTTGGGQEGGFSSLACYGSPVILKINNDGTTDVNLGSFPGLTDGDADGSGTSSDPWTFNGFTVWLTDYNGYQVNQVNWTYDSSGPAVTYFLVKFGNNEYYYGDGNSITSGFASAYGQGSGVSHIEFYDTGHDVAEPGTVTLLGIAAFGMAALRRRRGAQRR